MTRSSPSTREASGRPARPPVRRIVVGIDGTPLSRSAFAYGVMLADAAGLEIRAIHVVEPPRRTGAALPASDAAPPAPAPGAAAGPGDLALAQATMDECEAFCKTRGIRFSSAFLHGPLIDRLLEAQDTDILAVGKGRFAHAGPGSATRHLMRQAPCPVLIAGGPLRQVNRIVGAYDGTPASERAVAVAESLAAQTRWPLTILAVAGRLTLSEALQGAQDRAPTAQVVAFGPGEDDEASQIEEAAAHARFGLPVIPAYTDSPLRLLLGGGTTGHVLAHVEGAIVLVH
jgi:nucleotide-binding universal stress UspA family protein